MIELISIDQMQEGFLSVSAKVCVEIWMLRLSAFRYNESRGPYMNIEIYRCFF